jgi:hypothetical protein
LRDRAQHPIRHVRRSRDLKEVTAWAHTVASLCFDGRFTG